MSNDFQMMSSPQAPVSQQAMEQALVASREAQVSQAINPVIAQFEASQRIAKMYAASSVVPKEYHGTSAEAIGNCAVAFNIAMRLRVDPLMVMQNLYPIYGRPCWSAQFLIACFNTSGRFSPITYRFTGKPGTDSWGCVACSMIYDTGEKIESAEITIGLAKKEGWYNKNGSKWQSIPEQMMKYRSAAFLVRAHAPEIAFGFRTQDEEEDINGSLTEQAQKPKKQSALAEVLQLAEKKEVEE